MNYIIIFAGYKWAEGLNFQRIVTSRLNPLKLCLPVIVKTFSSLTRYKVRIHVMQNE